MPGATGATQFEIDLRQGKYQSSLESFRNLLGDQGHSPYLLGALRTPKNEVLEVQVQHEDVYVIAFKGADQWYNFGDRGALGIPSGVGSNYAQLGTVGNVVRQDLVELARLSQFKKGVSIDKRLCAILFAVVSEAARFATAATYFTGMTNGIVGGMHFEHMRTNYFNNWTKPPDEEMEPGKLYHYRKSDVLLARDRN